MPERQFEEIGDRLTRALVSGDFALYRAVMDLPLRIAPRDDAAYVLATEAELRADFDLYHAMIKSQGVTDIYRQILRLDEVAPDRRILRCLTHIMVRAHRIVDPFETRMTLIRRGATWHISEIESSEGHIKWALGRAVITRDGHFEPKD